MMSSITSSICKEGWTERSRTVMRTIGTQSRDGTKHFFQKLGWKVPPSAPAQAGGNSPWQHPCRCSKLSCRIDYFRTGRTISFLFIIKKELKRQRSTKSMQNGDDKSSSTWDFFISSRKCDHNKLHRLEVRARKELTVTAYTQSLVTDSGKK